MSIFRKQFRCHLSNIKKGFDILFSYGKLLAMKTTSKLIAGTFAIASLAHAGAPVVQSKVETTPQFAFQGGASVGYESAFVFRGLKLDNNPVFRGGLNGKVVVAENVFGLDKVSVYGGLVQTLNTEQPNASWYRSDVELGFVLQKGDFSLVPTYQVVNSPNGAFKSAQGINVSLAFDDSKYLGALALNPKGSVYFGLDGNLGGGTGKGGQQYELSVEPSYSYAGIKFSAPIAVGFGSGNYYAANSQYGYTSVGVAAETKITTNLSVKTGINHFSTSSKINADSSFWQSTVSVGYQF